MEHRLEILRDEIDKIILNEKSDHLRMYLSHMYGVARFCILLAMKRNLDTELAATCGMLHDIFYMCPVAAVITTLLRERSRQKRY